MATVKQWFHLSIALLFSAGCAHGTVAHKETKSEHGHTAEWGYHGDIGPEKWGVLKPEFAVCRTGQAQSPVDIVLSRVTQWEAPTMLELVYQEVPLVAHNNGHTLQANIASGSTVAVGDETYALRQLHFHTPSENTIDGQSTAGELHLVHENDGSLLVIGVLLVEGETNAAFGSLLEHAPAEPGRERVVEGVRFNPNELLPESLDYFHFEGSLTTPPCTEGVRWFVLRQAVSASRAQLALFKKIIGSNARPTQPLNGRIIYSK